MIDGPDLVHNLFSLICDVMIALAQRVQERQRRSGFHVNHFCVSNCTVNMISPKHYRDFVFPYDKRIAESFERFGVHTCNWDVTPYLEELRELPKVGYLDMGMDSDMDKARTLFPEARRAVLYSPVKLQEAPIEEIEKDMERIYKELSPCDVVMADIQSTTPDSRVNELLGICRNLEER
jgi:uroporphyrinogen-III decarboxylase